MLAVIPAACAIATALFAAANAFITANLKQYIAECRENDKRELREWINGSFMRSAVAETKIEGLRESLKELKAAHRHV